MLKTDEVQNSGEWGGSNALRRGNGLIFLDIYRVEHCGKTYGATSHMACMNVNFVLVMFVGIWHVFRTCKQRTKQNMY